MRTVIIKNNSVSGSATYGSQMISSGESYTIKNERELSIFSDCQELRHDITQQNPSIVINNGSSDLLPVAGENWLTGVIGSYDSDGSQISRLKIAKSGWTQRNLHIELETAVSGSVYSQSSDGDDNYASVFYYKTVSGAFVLCDNASDVSGFCTRTVLDWEPDHDYEIIGGETRALQRPTSNVRVDVIGAPDIPSAYGGSKYMVIGANFRFFNDREPVIVNGRTTKFLPYNPVYHTGKLRFVFDHDPGLGVEFLIKIEVYME